VDANLKTWSYRLVGTLVSILFVYLAVRNVDLSESVRALGNVKLGWLVAAVLVYLSNFPFRALRWRKVLQGQREFSLREMMVPVLVGHMANNVLPARTGELYRAHFLGRRTGISRSGAVGSIVVERTLDGLMLLALISLVFVLFPQTRFLGAAVVGIGLVFLVLAAGILLYSLAADRAHRLLDRLLGLLPKRIKGLISPRLGFFLEGVRGVTGARGYAEAGGYTAVIFLLEAAAIALVIASFGIALPPSGYLLVFTLASLGTTLPSGPGYVGPYQYAFVLGLSVFAVRGEEALAVSVVAQVALLGSITLIGLALLWREQLRGGLTLKVPEPERPEPARREKVG
jgi:uncharacterized protein (TIRG00374 family)